MSDYNPLDPQNQGQSAGNVPDGSQGVYQSGPQGLINPIQNPYVQSPQMLQQAANQKLGTMGQVATLQQAGASQQLANQIQMEQIRQQQQGLQQDQIAQAMRNNGDRYIYGSNGNLIPNNINDPLADHSPQAYALAGAINQSNLQNIQGQSQMQQLQLQQQIQPLQQQMNNPYLQQAVQMKQQQDANNFDTVKKLNDAGNLAFDSQGNPLMQDTGLGGIKIWKSLDNSDPTKNLPYGLGAILTDPRALTAAGIQVTPQILAAGNRLWGRQQGMSPEQVNNPAFNAIVPLLKQGMPIQQALQLAQQHATDSSNPAYLANAAQSTPASGVQAQPQVADQATNDINSIKSGLNNFGDNVSDAADVVGNTIQASADSVANRWGNVLNQVKRVGNVGAALVGSNWRSQPYPTNLNPFNQPADFNVQNPIIHRHIPNK